MIGTHHIEVTNDVVTYSFDLHRNITILRGDSATGKTALYNMIEEYNESAGNSGNGIQPSLIRINCDKPCIALNRKGWIESLGSIKDSIIFIDENSINYLDSETLARGIKQSDNYYVLITRKELKNLPYSITEIYDIRESGKYSPVLRAYNEFDRIYKASDKIGTPTKKNVIITEDSGSGYEMFTKAFPNCKVEPAGGKSNIVNKIMEHPGEEVVAIADGAAFGCEIDSVLTIINIFRSNAILYAPESFEYLILHLKFFKRVKTMIENTEDYVESSEYFSWEKYFTNLLKQELNRLGIRYNKGKMPKQLLNDRTLAEYRSILPDIFK